MFTELGVHSSAITRKFPYGSPANAGPKFFDVFSPILAQKLQSHRHLGQNCSVHDRLSPVT
jgi:hypothetical protein